MRRRIFLVLTLPALLLPLHALAQTGTITGQVSDPQGAVMRDAEVRVTSATQGTGLAVRTNAAGRYTAPFLEPGPYRIQVRASGFATMLSDTLTLSVDQTLVFDARLTVGSENQRVVVEGGSEAINTTDATVGTVVDRQFVQEIPLNGRSFQSLVLLSPGAVTSNPQGTSATGDYSVNGLPSYGNSFTLDGASASNTNAVSYNGLYGGAGTSGMAANSTALGTTHALISVDALEEFQIATSTYSAQFGRQPGAVISFQSRSGTNEYHGTAFDYLRNAALDANNWFNDYATPAIPKPQERQNDFGGVFGGPLGIPGVLSGRDRSFFFLSYEGLRLTQPGAATIGYVPSNGTYNTAEYSNPLLMNLRANAPQALQAVFNGFLLPNCTTARDPQCVDNGDGLSPVIFAPSTLGNIDVIGGRLDLQAARGTRLFARYSDTESSSEQEVESSTRTGNGEGNTYRTRVYLLGANSTLGASLANELRLQYSSSSYSLGCAPTSSGGAQPADLRGIAGESSGEINVELEFPDDTAIMCAENAGTRQFQPNAVDTATWQRGSHLLRAGANYIQTTAYMADGALSRGPVANYFYKTGAQALGNTLYEAEVESVVRQDPTYRSLGLFLQDEWRYRPGLSLSLGLRWDLSPSPSVSGIPARTYSGDLNDIASITLAPVGTPLYGTTYTNFAPRFGLAAVLRNQPGHELVLRAGGGLFYGTGQTFQGVVGDGYGLGAGDVQSFKKATAPKDFPFSFPFPPAFITNSVPPIAPPYAFGFVVNRRYTPPASVQWSVALEQAIGRAQTVSLSYVATDAPALGHWIEYQPGELNTLFSSFYAWQNGPGSDYNSLQVEYKRRAFRGLQVLAGYTWSHAIDSNSTDYSGGLALQRGNSDFDVRHNFNAALVYQLPAQYRSRWQREILGGWNADMRLAARTGFPVEVQGANLTDTITGQEYSSRLNYSGLNPYTSTKGVPGGRQFNPGVFSVPTVAEGDNGNAPRNFLRGFGYSEADISVQRNLRILEELGLLLRVEAFNVTNSPAFGAIDVTCGSTTAGSTCSNGLLGQATATLSNSLSGLSSIYQQGGPRSLQLALKLQF